MKRTRSNWIPFSFYDHTGMEKHLEKMAQKGWMLEELTSLGWKYRAMEPKKLHFTVSFDTRASEFEPEPTEEQVTFQEFCAGTRGGSWLPPQDRCRFFTTRRRTPCPSRPTRNWRSGWWESWPSG